MDWSGRSMTLLCVTGTIEPALPNTVTRPTLIQSQRTASLKERPVSKNGQSKRTGEDHALRIANLRMRPGQAARPQQTLLNDHVEDLGTAWHQTGCVLDDRDRRVEPAPVLHAAVGFAGGSREEVERVPGRSRMAYRTREDRGG